MRRLVPILVAFAAASGAASALAGGGKVTATVTQVGTSGTLTVANTGKTTIKYVYFHPTGGTVTATPKANGGAASDGDGMWNGLDLAPGKTVTLRFTARGTVTGGTISVNDHVGNDGMSRPMTVAKGGGTQTPPPTTTSEQAATADLDLTVVGKVVPVVDESGHAGLRIRVQVHNKGPARASGIHVHYVKLAESKATPAGLPSIDPRNGPWQLEPGASRVVTVKFFFPASAVGSWFWTTLGVYALDPKDPHMADNTVRVGARVVGP